MPVVKYFISFQLDGFTKVELPYSIYCYCSTIDHNFLITGGNGGILVFSHDDISRPLYRFNTDM